MSERAHFSTEQRESLLQKFQQSGMTVTDFAHANGLSRSLLSVWTVRYLPKGTPPSAVPAELVTQPPAPRLQEIDLSSFFSASPWAAEFVLPGGASLKLTSQGLEQILPQLRNYLGPPCSR